MAFIGKEVPPAEVRSVSVADVSRSFPNRVHRVTFTPADYEVSASREAWIGPAVAGFSPEAGSTAT